MPNALEIIRHINRSLRGWLESVRTLPDPTSQPAGILRHISQQLRIVDEALKQAPPALAANPEWREELDAYIDTLREVRARLGNFEITLRIRQGQASDARNRLAAVRSWSDLAKNIG